MTDEKSKSSSRDQALEDSSDDPLLNLLRPIVNNTKETPKMIRRYRVTKTLGNGSFGQVYLARDDQLQRDVAIKVPSAQYLENPLYANSYLEEARTIAGLEHPNIVPVYDVGTTYDFPCFIVTKYIEGKSLAQYLKKKKTSIAQAAKLCIVIARALHFAHQKGVVHRDIKPENILLNKKGKPFVVDLGLALTDSKFGTGPSMLGTPAYMSPEQARGEGHRVDGRTDVYSLGVMLYEMLLGKRPFSGSSSKQLIDNITQSEAKPLRQIDDSIPKELERICLKSIAKRASDRYTTARDFAEDLQAFLETQTVADTESNATVRSGSKAKDNAQPSSSTHSHSAPVSPRVIPKGLRAFDGHDSDFFLKLLPGVVDRNGLPDSIRFWKTRIEPQPRGEQRTFDVGVIYGPSGCGKSSFVQAGLIPNLGDDIACLFVEAADDNQVEARIIEKLQRAFSPLAGCSNLADAFKQLRANEKIRGGRKILIVIDQFEQWLHSHSRSLNESDLPPLAQALRQCDADSVQTLLLVRDDFWMSISNFMRAIEVQLSDGFNTGSVDLFDESHARKVLHQFGLAFDKLPAENLSTEQQAFLMAAVEEIADDGQVSCIKVALLAEMLKTQNWNVATLNSMGGIRGIGVRYLDQTFDSAATPPHYRGHADAIQQILMEMLPSDGISIRGEKTTLGTLADASGIAIDSAEFGEVVKILDRETRIITPADQSACHETPYQLTHDYLVPSIRQWLRQKQSQTQRGRAQIQLRERADSWNAKPESQRLPGPFELGNIHRFTKSKNRTPAQNKMVRAANRYYAIRVAATLAICGLILAGVIGFAVQSSRASRSNRASALVDALNTAPIEAVPYAINNLETVKPEARQRLNSIFANSDSDTEKLRAALALARFGDVQVDYLVEKLDDSDTRQIPLILDALANDREKSHLAIKQKMQQGLDEPKRIQYVLALMDLGYFDQIEPIVKIDDSPNDRSRWIVVFGEWQHNWEAVSRLLENASRPDVRSAILLGLSRFEPEQLDDASRERLVSQASDWYVGDPSAVVHSACQLLLERWKQTLPKIQTVSIAEKTQWIVSPSGHTMIRVKPGKFRFWNTKYYRTVEKEFWISDSEVSYGQFMEFYNDKSTPISEKPIRWVRFVGKDGTVDYWDRSINNRMMTVYFHRESQPVDYVNVQDAFLYCNWLSRKEGLQPCYKKTEKKYRAVAQGKSIVPKDDDPYLIWVWKLDNQANGYRLPFEFEWGLAGTAKSEQKFAYGDDASLIEHFAIFASPDADLVRDFPSDCRKRLPNNFGLFDMLGNVSEWTHRNIRRKQFDEYYGKDSVGQMESEQGDWFKTPVQRINLHKGSRFASTRDKGIGFRIARRIHASTNSAETDSRNNK